MACIDLQKAFDLASAVQPESFTEVKMNPHRKGLLFVSGVLLPCIVELVNDSGNWFWTCSDGYGDIGIEGNGTEFGFVCLDTFNHVLKIWPWKS